MIFALLLFITRDYNVDDDDYYEDSCCLFIKCQGVVIAITFDITDNLQFIIRF